MALRNTSQERRTSRSSERAPAGTPSGDAGAPGGWLPSLTLRVRHHRVSTRRHQKSEARHEQLVAGLVASCMADFQEHAHEARHFLVVSSVQADLARERDFRDTALDAFRETHDRIESLIRDHQWPALREFVSGLPEHSDVFIADTRSDVETALGELWQRFSGFGVAVSSSVVWLAEPQVYYLLLWKD